MKASLPLIVILFNLDFFQHSCLFTSA